MNQPEIFQETETYYVLNKPAGYSIEPHEQYPSISEWLNTEKNIYSHLKDADRFGIVHRLDVETSGVLIWAKTPTAQAELQKIWQGRAVKKAYLALVEGETPMVGSVELALERDTKKDRQRVAMLATDKSRPAITTYRRLAVGEWEKEKVSLVECHPVTGRTHQIRVHLAAINHPILGDKLYSTKSSRLLSEKLGIKRHMLHAWKIQLPDNPEFNTLPSPDFQKQLTALRLQLP